MKLGVVGKGGVGKTTISALLAEGCARRGQRVIAVDTDSNPNLGLSLGLSFEDIEAIPPLPRSVVLGQGDGLQPAELLRSYGRPTPTGVTLLSAIRVTQAGAGCTCGGHATLRSLLGTALQEHADVTVVDMEAGIEHLSRAGGTLAHADILVVVVEPTRKAAITAERTRVLAEELGIARTVAVGNKARRPDDGAFLAAQCQASGVELLGVVPFDPDVSAADRAGTQVAAAGAVAARAVVAEVIDRIVGVLTTSAPPTGT